MFFVKIVGKETIEKFFNDLHVSMTNAESHVVFLKKYHNKDELTISDTELIIQAFGQLFTTKDVVLRYSTELNVESALLIDMVYFEKDYCEK